MGKGRSMYRNGSNAIQPQCILKIYFVFARQLTYAFPAKQLSEGLFATNSYMELVGELCQYNEC